jgi:hypothetical protein
MKPDATLGRSSRKVMLDSIAVQNACLPIVHLYREREFELSLWPQQQIQRGLVQIQYLCGRCNLRLSDLKRVVGLHCSFLLFGVRRIFFLGDIKDYPVPAILANEGAVD